MNALDMAIKGVEDEVSEAKASFDPDMKEADFHAGYKEALEDVLDNLRMLKQVMS